jgi:hypothetical protein
MRLIGWLCVVGAASSSMNPNVLIGREHMRVYRELYGRGSSDQRCWHRVGAPAVARTQEVVNEGVLLRK